MEVDTGAAVTVMSRLNWQALFPKVPLNRSHLALTTYTAEKMTVLSRKMYLSNTMAKHRNFHLLWLMAMDLHCLAETG